jgi:methionyl-tRNA formyltransferase
MNPPRIIFAGTPGFAVASLKALIDSGIEPCAVLTQPDRPAGRGKRLSASPVKKVAVECGIPLMQPPSLRDGPVIAELKALQPDLIVVAAYGLILPQQVLGIPRTGCLNVHASLLPRWRGAAPIQAAILAGDKQSGICLMSMEAGLDTGAVYVREELSIGERDTAGELHDRLAAAGARLLAENLDAIVNGELMAVAQEEALASYAPKIKTADALLTWSRPAEELDRIVRAYNPVPGAWFMLGDERIKCWKAQPCEPSDAPAGTVVAADAEGIVIACGDGALRLEVLQRPGKRALTAGEFAAHTDLVGQHW